MLKKTFLILPFLVFSGCMSQFMNETPAQKESEEVKEEKPKVEKIHSYSVKTEQKNETEIISKSLPQTPETPKEKKELDEIETMIKGEL